MIGRTPTRLAAPSSRWVSASVHSHVCAVRCADAKGGPGDRVPNDLSKRAWTPFCAKGRVAAVIKPYPQSGAQGKPFVDILDVRW